MDKTAGIARSQRAARWEFPEPVGEGATLPLRARVDSVPNLPGAAGKAPSGNPPPRSDPDGETRTPTTTWDSAKTPTHPAVEDPRMADHLDPQAKDPPVDRREQDHLVDPRAEGLQTEDPLEDHPAETPPTNRREWTSPRTSGDGSFTSRGRSGTWSARRRSTRSRLARVPRSPPRPSGGGHRHV